MKEWGAINDESGESVEPMEGESEMERLLRGWRREASSWFQRRREVYWKDWFVVRRLDDVNGRASVTKEERVLRGGWTLITL